MNVDRAVLTFAGFVVLLGLALGYYGQSLLVFADRLCRAEHDPGVVHRLLPGRDHVQEAGFAQRQRIYLNNVVNRNWQRAIIRLAVAAKCARC